MVYYRAFGPDGKSNLGRSRTFGGPMDLVCAPAHFDIPVVIYCNARPLLTLLGIPTVPFQLAFHMLSKNRNESTSSDFSPGLVPVNDVQIGLKPQYPKSTAPTRGARARAQRGLRSAGDPIRRSYSSVLYTCTGMQYLVYNISHSWCINQNYVRVCKWSCGGMRSVF